MIILQLVYLPRLFEDDFTFQSFPYYICTQAVQFTSISAACVAYFWPFLRSLRTGLMSSNNKTFISRYTLGGLNLPDVSDQGGVMGQRRSHRDYTRVTMDNAIVSNAIRAHISRETIPGEEVYMTR